MQKQGLGYLILQAPYNVFYATGYTSGGKQCGSDSRRGGCPPPDQHPGERRRLRIHAGWDVREFMSWVFIDNGTEESRRDKGDVMDPDAIIHICLDLIKKYPHGWQGGHRDGQCHAPFLHRPHRGLAGGWWWMAPTVTRNCRVVKCQWEIDMLRLAAQEADKAWRAMIERSSPVCLPGSWTPCSPTMRPS